MSVKNIVETLGLEMIVAPVDMNGAVLASDYINMKNADKISILLMTGVGASTAAVTVKQATDAAAASEKAVNFSVKHRKVGITGTVWVKETVTSDTFNLSGTAASMYLIEIPAASLDQANLFNFVRVAVADPTVSQFICGVYILSGLRDQRAILPDYKV